MCLSPPEILLGGWNYGYQLLAIRDLLKVHRKERASTLKDIKRLSKVALKDGEGPAFEDLQDLGYFSTYQDAAHSMAAVGMLAPFVESLFHRIFEGIREHNKDREEPFSSHFRWKQATQESWDCHYVWRKNKREKNLVKGIMQLSEAVDLKKHLPSELETILEALFAYRNAAFHNGFEWPEKKCENFDNLRKNKKWPDDWFATATIDGKPWMFYLTDRYIDLCISKIEQVIKVLGEYAHAMLRGR